MVLLLGLAGKEALSHQRTYSPVEKRELQTRPEISITKVLDGRFQKKYESYLRDQFPGRDHWVSFQTDMELFMGKNEIHNVYIGKNHYLLEHYTEKEFDPQQISKNLQALEKFVGKAKQNADVHVMMVPTKSWVLREKLPAFAPHYKEQKFYDALQQKLEKEDVLISVEPVLDAHKEEEIYYRTDHHWTTQGAFYVFQDAAKTLGIDEDVSGSFVSYTVTDQFIGVLASTSGVGLDEYEQIDIYVPSEGDDDVVVNYVDEGRKTTSLYDSSKLETRDKYGVFLGGNTSVVDIKTVSTSQRRLLIVKDSFADCMIPFLISYYREIIVVDADYYQKHVSDLLDKNKITSVLFLYDCNHFVQMTS